ncbi:MAG: hypothetical protein Q9213_001392 [Squamulea squamosa]
MTSAGKLQLPASCDPPRPQNPPEQLVWVIFGATGQIGRSVAKAALAHNDLVTGVGRSHEDTLPSVQDTFPAYPDRYIPLLCDVRLRSTVEDVIQQSITHWGRIDIIANCTGYGVIGACEDQDDYDIRNQFETNFFGTVNILHASLAYFRTRQRYQQTPSSASIKHEPSEEQSVRSTDDEQQPLGGRYLIFSSTSGALGTPGLGPYSATKHAVEGLIESMLYETHAFNIKATLVELGYLQHDDIEVVSTSAEDQRLESRHHDSAPFTHFLLKPPLPNSPYNTPTSPASHPHRVLQWLSQYSDSSPDNQLYQYTSTVRCAELIWQLGHCTYPPLRLLLGAFAVEGVRDRLRCVIEEIEEWKWLGFGSGEEEEDAEGDGREGSREVKEDLEGDDDGHREGDRGEEDVDGHEEGAKDGMEVDEWRG